MDVLELMAYLIVVSPGFEPIVTSPDADGEQRNVTVEEVKEQWDAWNSDP